MNMAENSSPSPNPIQSNNPLNESTNPQLQTVGTPPTPSASSNGIPQQTSSIQQQQQQQRVLQSQQQQHSVNSNSTGGGNTNSNNLMAAAANLQMQQNMQRSPSMSRMNQIQQQQQLGMIRQQPGMYGQMNFCVGAGTGTGVIQQQQQQQSLDQQQQQQINQMAQMGGGNLTRSALMGQTGHLSSLSNQAAAAAQFNLQSQYLNSPRQKAGMMQGSSQFHTGNSTGQSLQGLQGMGMMGSHTLTSQLRANGSIPYGQQRMSQGQLMQHLSQQNALSANQKLQVQNMPRASVMSQQFSALAQNGQPATIQNSLSQQQWLKQMPAAISSANSPSYRLQQRILLQHLAASPQSHQNAMALTQHQLQIAQQQQQMSHKNPQQQQPSQQQQLQEQLLQVQQQNQQQQQQQQQQKQNLLPPLQQLEQQQSSVLSQQQSPRMMPTGGQKSLQPDATPSGTTSPGGSASPRTVSSNQLQGKRKIQDLVLQVDPQRRLVLDPDVEDLLLEFADEFIDSVTTFACTLAKHRKSSTLESKDVLLHLEKNLNLSVPGFSSEERKRCQNFPPNNHHKKRLDVRHAWMKPSSLETTANNSTEMITQGPSNHVGPNHILRPTPDQFLSQPNAAHQTLSQTTKF